LGDQSPGKEENCYWVDFLNQKTAFFFGTEILANQMDAAVVYAVIHKTKRGYYEIELREITQKPLEEPYGKITGAYITALESDIIKHPYAWLWSHKRWKKQVPTDLKEIQENHEKRFLSRFRKDKE
jgi:KDO2-lipid IV(A) lauroyltransferase